MAKKRHGFGTREDNPEFFEETGRIVGMLHDLCQLNKLHMGASLIAFLTMAAHTAKNMGLKFDQYEEQMKDIVRYYKKTLWDTDEMDKD